MKYILDTERLRLRELTIEDSDFIISLLNSEGWISYIGNRNVRNKEQAIKYLENGPFRSYTENGYGISLVEQIADSKPVGMCGLIRRDQLENPDIGFAFLPEHQGKGYAFEIAAATLAYAQNQLAIPEICAITNPDNTRSIRLLEKMGLKFSRIIFMTNPDEELLLYQTINNKIYT